MKDLQNEYKDLEICLVRLNCLFFALAFLILEVLISWHLTLIWSYFLALSSFQTTGSSVVADRSEPNPTWLTKTNSLASDSAEVTSSSDANQNESPVSGTVGICQFELEAVSGWVQVFWASFFHGV